MSSRLRSFLLFVLVAFLIFGAAYNGYQLGTRRPKTIIIKGIDNIQGSQVANADFNIFWQTWDLIKQNYLKAGDLNNKDLIYGSTAGLVEALNDPYSAFLTPVESKQFIDDISGSFGGIGAEIGVRGDFVVIVSPLKGSPAEKAGLKAGDKILEVNASSTINLSIDKVVRLIRGPRGTEAKLTVLRNGEEKPREIKIIREIINIPTIEWEMKDNKIAHVNLFNFNEEAPNLFVKVVREALTQGAQGMVLDLRNNPGGFLEVSVSIAGLFIESGKEVVAEEFSSGERNSFVSRGNAALKDFPTVILINKGSASASEILTGALRDHNKTPIVGEKSFGKGTVQELKELPDGSTLKITVAHWVLPNGEIIEGNGIEPDYDIKLTDEDAEKERDPQLDKAIEVLTSRF